MIAEVVPEPCDQLDTDVRTLDLIVSINWADLVVRECGADECFQDQGIEPPKIADERVACRYAGCILGEFRLVGRGLVPVAAISADETQPQALLVDIAKGRQSRTGINQPGVARGIGSGPNLLVTSLGGRNAGDEASKANMVAVNTISVAVRRATAGRTLLERVTLFWGKSRRPPPYPSKQIY